ncbi:kinase-like protein [Wallemia mellicola]|uniref:non-specific serine/threonine protein kinase n=1 Tax=Wallemia mellicola TaxID=1708541 RepID=A0AB38MX67_9BASI|nr:kinase-like protein [Wallemia mellicola]TIB89771.1 kinase-like protein [Wallemia mellicola]TIC06251.1 kinase-like protein [Wallemia mellicola]TIC36038.1 kinase-like protein [Wallemia mellicola]TIC41831.1 kinase-like protein [Wallemia mellicola]
MATKSPNDNFLNDYESIEVIGQGSFGKIRKVRRKRDGMVFARKELDFDKMSDRDRKQIVAEVNILRELDHTNIVAYHERFKYVDREGGMLYILMEFCGGGDLQTIIKSCKRSNTLLPEDTIWSYISQLAGALDHCHRRGSTAAGPQKLERRPSQHDIAAAHQQILHRDLKPENVFLDNDGNLKLGDFGLSKATQIGEFAKTYVGTPYYMSPELMKDMPYDHKSDIWSLGCVVYELACLNPPFYEAKTHGQLQEKILQGRIPRLSRFYSPMLDDMIRRMLSPNPRDRPSASQILEHDKIKLQMRTVELNKMAASIASQRVRLSERLSELQAREKKVCEREQQISVVETQIDAYIKSQVEKNVRFELERIMQEGGSEYKIMTDSTNIEQRDREIPNRSMKEYVSFDSLIILTVHSSATPSETLAEMSICTPPQARRMSSKQGLNAHNATQAKLLALAREEDEAENRSEHVTSKPPPLQRAETAPVSTSSSTNSIPQWTNLPPPPPTPSYANVTEDDLPSPFLRKTDNKQKLNQSSNPRQGLLAQAAAQRTTTNKSTTVSKRPSMVSVKSSKPVLGR